MYGRRFFAAVLALVSLAGGCGRDSSPSANQAPPINVSAPDPSACVSPTPENVQAGRYPLARPLYIYVNKKYLAEKPALYHFVRFYLENAREYLSHVGYFPFPEATYQENIEKFEATGEPPAVPQSGQVLVDGSSTVYPVTQAVAEEFQKQYPGIHVLVGVSGTGGGFKKFVRGETDINDASRPIKPAEIELCKQNGIEYVEFKIGIDALVVAVNPANDWCDCLSIAQLREIWKPGSQVRYWSQIQPDWPAEEISLYGADSDSGTFDYFTEAVVGEARASRSDYTPSADDNVLVRGIAGDRYALGYIPFAYYIENKDSLKALKIAPSE